MRKKDEEKLQSIREAVIKLLLKEGFQGASIAKIAKEAGISPATIYIYYQNKDDMLRDVYRQYGEHMYEHLINRISDDMSGELLLETLVRSYYEYITRNKEAFYFVEQYASCPALVSDCEEMEGCAQMGLLFDQLKLRKIIKKVDNTVIIAILFNPIKNIAVKHFKQDGNAELALNELIKLIQDALLIR
ncbi:MAG: TetR/AcrR family transcriptional regulator [Syntrophomonadaceae bacterium]|jgi:AcrR family transcriptional regulator